MYKQKQLDINENDYYFFRYKVYEYVKLFYLSKVLSVNKEFIKSYLKIFYKYFFLFLLKFLDKCYCYVYFIYE